MAIYGNYADTPNQIVKEGEEITVKFVRNGDGTGTVSWNIPSPSNGCSVDNQAYDGILITASSKPADYITTSPKNANIYEDDPTVDPDMHTGSKLGTALVVGTFYHDKKTTSLTVTDVDPNKFYYISAYAIDNVGRYHREGVHAYSISTGSEEKDTEYFNAYQNILLFPNQDSIASITLNTMTGLDPSTTYTLHMQIDSKDYFLKIKGMDAQTYSDLVDAINKEFKLISGAYAAPLPPNANQYYVDLVNQKLYFYDGFKNIAKPVTFIGVDPTTHPQGTYWYDTLHDIMYMYETGGWSPQPFVKLANDPTKPICGQLWFTGSEVYEWDGDHWIKLCLYIQTRNPSLAPILDCNTYWYDTVNGTLAKWNADAEKFDDILAIISKKDPNTLGVGDFWLNETDGKMYKFSAGQWNLTTNVRYDEPNADGTVNYPATGTYWLNPETQKFYKRDDLNTAWVEVEYTMYPTDPINRSSNDLWWNQSPSVDSLFVWDIVNTEWKIVANFLQQTADPSQPPNLPPCVVWYNPKDGTLKYILKNSCVEREFISFPYDPTRPPVGTVWYNETNKTYYTWDGLDWDIIHPIISDTDPFDVYVGYMWFDTVNNQLKEWNGTAWVVTPFSLHPLMPQIGTLWYDTVNDELFQWTGTNWIVSQPIATVSFKYQVSKDPRWNNTPYLHFESNANGCGHSIYVVPDADGIFAKLTQSVLYADPVEGNNGIDAGPMYKQLGVGTDGSPDERRALHNSIRNMLGSVSVTVELTKEQINEAIDNALLMFRKYSGYGSSRNMFFLDAKPNQQTYILSNKCVGFNKISDVRVIHRMKAGWITAGLAGNGLFGVAALQQLYTVGTFDMLSYHLMSSYMKELEQLFATRIMHQWVEESRELRLFSRITMHERMLLDVTIEKTEQDLFTSRESALWIKKYALAEAKMMLSHVRGKYQTLPGPNGSTTLNSQELSSQADTERQALMEELNDPAMANYQDVGLGGHFVIG